MGEDGLESVDGGAFLEDVASGVLIVAMFNRLIEADPSCTMDCIPISNQLDMRQRCHDLISNLTCLP